MMPKIKKEWVDEVIIVDGNSTDGTIEYLESLGYRVIRQRTPGLAAAYWECFDAATGDVIVMFTPDGNSVPEVIPLLIDKMKEGYDMVVASRYLKGAKSEDDDVVTAFGNRMFTWMVNILFNARYTDVLVGYRAYKKDLIQRLNLTRSPHPLLEQELMIRCVKHGLKITEIPADEPKRIGGVRKMRVLYNGSAVLYGILRELFVHRVKRPTGSQP